MSVTGDYTLILGRDQPPPSADREQYDIDRSKSLVSLDVSTAMLAAQIDSVDWDGEAPTIGRIDGHRTYFWSNVRGPYYKSGDQWLPIEALIKKSKDDHPKIERHYSLIVWVEG